MAAVAGRAATAWDSSAISLPVPDLQCDCVFAERALHAAYMEFRDISREATALSVAREFSTSDRSVSRFRVAYSNPI